MSDLDAMTFVRGLLFSLLVYAAGMVLNDVFDADEDRRLGRDRALVANQALRPRAAAFGLALLGAALAVAPWHRLGWVPAAIAAGVLVYDWGWRRPGSSQSRPLLPSIVALGLCRAFNLYAGTLLIAAAPASASEASGVAALLATPTPELVAYGLYAGLAVYHGSLEDRATTKTASNTVLAAALLLPALACLRLPFAVLGIALAATGFYALWRAPDEGPAWLAKRTGILLRGLSRFGLCLALASGAWLSASLIAIPAFGLPWLMARRTRWT